MFRRHQWLLTTILFVMLFTTLGLTSVLASSTPEFRHNTITPKTVNGVFPPCGPANDGEEITVGGNRYICGCVSVIKGEPCSWVWRNLDAEDYSSLEMDQGVLIANGKARLYFQPDGNLVVYDEFGYARWASHTVGLANKMLFQTDGNFVGYSIANHSVWASNTCCWSGSHLRVQNDGNVVIYNWFGFALWATNTYH